MRILCDGLVQDVDDKVNSILDIPVTEYSEDFWEFNHSVSMSVDIEIDGISGTINLDDNCLFAETHQVDDEGVHNFSIHPNKWVSLVSKLK